MNGRQTLTKTGVEDRHRLDADPDPTFPFYAGPDPDTPSFTQVGKPDIFLPFIHSSARCDNF